MLKQLITILIVALAVLSVRAQELKTHYLPAITVGQDTLPHVQLSSIPVFPRKQFKSKRMEQKYWRLVMRVKKTYPYAKIAAQLMNEYEAKFRESDDPKMRKVYLKEAEKELFDKYGPQLKKLSISEGRILIRLIDRETKNTSYNLIKDLKGGVSAFFWQGIARVFGNNLKDEYDPESAEEDKLIEEIIVQIDAGLI
ncbi:MAG: DUF4294 domain-containing protein [Mangrovibacterium sp.]